VVHEIIILWGKSASFVVILDIVIYFGFLVILAKSRIFGILCDFSKI